MEARKSYLDIDDRKVIVIDKENMHSYYAKHFLVTYRVTPEGMYSKVLLMILFFAIFYAVIIVFSRIKLNLD